MKQRIIILLIMQQCVHCFIYSANQNQEKNSFEKYDYAKRNGSSKAIVPADTLSKQEVVNMVRGFYRTYMTNAASSVKITQLTDNTYQMSYTIGESVYPINLKAVRKDNRYWIDSIEIGKKMK